MIKRDTIIFGNGLGMALDPSYFRLDQALHRVWSDPSYLSDDQRELILSCIPGRDIWSAETQMITMQLAADASDYLKKIQSDGVHWLTSAGDKFPETIKKYISKVAFGFIGNHHLPNFFIDPLISYVRDTKSHIATLNYDALLYEPLVKSGILRGFNGVLVDGFLSQGFHSSNTVRMFSNDFGYYLHLHGSPLFIDNGAGLPKKLPFDEITTHRYTGNESDHLVLTHVNYKQRVINRSSILSVYWSLLNLALNESDKIFIIGYSGQDKHLNKVISTLGYQKKVIVVEWLGDNPSSHRERESAWKEFLGLKYLQLIRLDNILQFSDWELLEHI